MNKKVFLFGTIIAAALIGILLAGMGKDPREIESPLIGKAAPAFALKTVGSGDIIDVASLRGSPVVVNFWATWCRPCWEEHPVLTETSREFGDRVRFVGVVFQDDDAKIQSFLRERGSAYPTVVDERGKTAIAYGVGGVPETFFLDASGRIVAKFSGPISQEQLRANVLKAMGR